MTRIEVGQSLREVAEEVAATWKAAEAGQPVAADDRLVFRDREALCAVLMPKRLDLLRHLRLSPASGIRFLAQALGRDVRRVHADVVALAELGLVVRGKDGGLSAVTGSPFPDD